MPRRADIEAWNCWEVCTLVLRCVLSLFRCNVTASAGRSHALVEVWAPALR